MPYCRNCGHNVAAEARVCPNCNYPQDTVPSAPGQFQPPQVPLQTQQQQGFVAPTSPVPQAFPAGVVVVRRTDGQATAALVLGILGIVVCPIVLSIIAIVIGRQSMKRIEASGGMLEGHQMAKAGWILGIVGLILWGLAIVAYVALFAFVIAVEGF